MQQEVLDAGGALVSESGRLIPPHERSPSESPLHRRNPRVADSAQAQSQEVQTDAADGERPSEQQPEAEADAGSDASKNGLDLVLKTAGIFLWRHSYLLVLICMTVREAPTCSPFAPSVPVPRPPSPLDQHIVRVHALSSSSTSCCVWHSHRQPIDVHVRSSECTAPHRTECRRPISRAYLYLYQYLQLVYIRF